MRGIIPKLFDCWADPVVHLLLQKRAPWPISCDKKVHGSPGLVVMGRDSHSEGCGFESCTVYWRDIFSHLFVVNICNVCLQRPKINEKRPGLAHFLKKVGVSPKLENFHNLFCNRK